MTTLTQNELLEAWGKPAEAVSAELEVFSDTAKILSSSRPRLIDQHPQQWVGLYNGNVEVIGKSLEAVMKEADERGYPREALLVRFIDREEKTLFL